MNPLVNPARCALADLVGMYYEYQLNDAAEHTIVDLYNGLKAVGENVEDYTDVVEDIMGMPSKVEKPYNRKKITGPIEF